MQRQSRKRIRPLPTRQVEHNTVPRLFGAEFLPQRLERIFPERERQLANCPFLFPVPRKAQPLHMPAGKLVQSIVRLHALCFPVVPLRIQCIPAQSVAMTLREHPAVDREPCADVFMEGIFRLRADARCLIPVAAVVFFGEVPFFAERKHFLYRHALHDVQHDSLFANIRRRNEPLVPRPEKRLPERKLLTRLPIRAPEAARKRNLPRLVLRFWRDIVIKFLRKAELSIIKAGLYRVDIFPWLCHRAQVERGDDPVERRHLLFI